MKGSLQNPKAGAHCLKVTGGGAYLRSMSGGQIHSKALTMIVITMIASSN